MANKVKLTAVKTFDGVEGYKKAGETFEASKERAEILKSRGFATEAKAAKKEDKAAK
jgi:hypothetical protein